MRNRGAFFALLIALFFPAPSAVSADLRLQLPPETAAPPAAANPPMITPGEGELVPDDMPAPNSQEPPITAPPQLTEEPSPPKEFNAVRLQGLNKVTAHLSVLDAQLGTVARFGNLEIIARRCWQAPPEQQPENAALLEVRELKVGEQPETIFSGWMFSSSPGLSALEHPVYDLTVISCESKNFKD